MVPMTPVSATITTRIRVDALKLERMAMMDCDVECFSKVFPSGGYFNVDMTTVSNGSTELRLSDEQSYPDKKNTRMAEDSVALYLKNVAYFL